MDTVKKEEPSANRKLTADKMILLLCKTIIFAISLSYMLKAFSFVYYHEIDSYVLPMISAQYRHTLIITQEDIYRAQEDFPDYYVKIDDFDSLRSSKLSKITDDRWVAFYFPSYSLMCLPLKMLFQLIGINQAWAFTVMNALFVISALIYMYRKLNVSAAYKLLAVLLFIISPIYMYIEYISAEAMMFSLITIALVMFSNKQYRTAAFLIAVASMTNPTVMAFGIVMVIDYFIKMYGNRKNVKILSKENIISVVKYGCCYLPCLIPFAFNFLTIGTGNPTASGATLKDYWSRVLSYFFDVNLGFFSFAPMTLCAFFILLAISLKRHQLDSLVYAGFLIGPVLAYSLMIYMNCVPTFCARYVMWTYPALLIGTVLLAERIVPCGAVKYVFGGTLTAAAAAMIAIDSIPMYYFGFNGMTEFLLENVPAAYSPYRATFYAGNDKYNWPYDIDCPSYYFSEKNGELRKLLFRSTDDYKNEVISSLNGSKESLEKFSEIVNKIPSDGKFHYINISPFSDIRLMEQTSEERGVFCEDKAILQINGPINVGCEPIEYETKLVPDTYYKIELEIDEGLSRGIKDGFRFCVNNSFFTLTDFVCNDENKYTLIFFADDSNICELNKLQIYSMNDITVDSFRLTSMINTETITVSDGPAKFSGGNAEDTILYPVQLAPMKHYVVDVKISNKSEISDKDMIFCTIDYEKRFNHILKKAQITEGENKLYLYAGDTTIGTGPTYIKIYGKSENEIEIGSVSIEYAQ